MRNAGRYFQSQIFKMIGHQRCRAVLPVTKFWMGVNVAPPFDHTSFNSVGGLIGIRADIGLGRQRGCQ